MNKKEVYILRYDDDSSNEQIGIFETKALMFKTLYENMRDDLDIDIEDPIAVLDTLDYYTYETTQVDTSQNKVYTLYEYSCNGFNYISTVDANTKNRELGYLAVVESAINQKDLQGIYL